MLVNLADMHNWCRANGISVSLCQDSQRSAKDLLDELFLVGNSAPVYSGDTLKVIPYDEVSAAGNGAIYTAPTAGGPVANLTDKDFVRDGNNPPVRISRKRRTDCDNVVSIEHIDRNLDYAHNTTSECDQRAVALFGPRKGGKLDAADLGMNLPSGSKSLLSIHSAEVAQKVASILAKRGAAGVNEYSFTLKAEWFYLEAMDLVTVSDERLGLSAVPVRLTSVKENANRTLACTGEQFIYGLNHPDVKDTTAATGTLVQVNVDPGMVNAPIIFEPPQAMLAGAGRQVWLLVSGADPNYGGCMPFVSVDGGASYEPLGTPIGPATTGELTADFASGSDPDTTHTLAVDLSESHGELVTEAQQVADGFADPCYVHGVTGSPAVGTFEVICPTAAALTSANHYSLSGYLRRAVQGTTVCDHPTGSRFGVLDAAVLKVDLPEQWIGKTLHFKFAAYNKIGSQQNSLDQCADYTYTPSGVPIFTGLQPPSAWDPDKFYAVNDLATYDGHLYLRLIPGGTTYTDQVLSRTGWTPSASSSYGGSPGTYDPSKALDGNPATFWGSNSGYPQSYVCDQGAARELSAIKLLSRQDTTVYGATTIDVYVSDDGSTWGSSIGTFTLPTPGTLHTAEDTFTLSAVFNKRYVKLVAPSPNPGGVGTFNIAEFNLIGPMAAEPDVDTTNWRRLA